MCEFCCARVLYAHAQVVKRVVGLYDDGSNKPFRAVERLEADYVDRCCSAETARHYVGQLDGLSVSKQPDWMCPFTAL